MTELETLHRKAMDLADDAAYESSKGNVQSAHLLYTRAFESERAAAQLVAGALDLEPTRSVLFRSAASLAIDCGEYREAERLVAQGLIGNPPEDIAEELRNLLERVHFKRHLAVRGVTLQRAEFQMSLAGAAVGYGIAPSEEFVTRVQDVDRLLYRTAERKVGRPFRERAHRSPRLAKQVETFLSVPRAASFAITVHIGYPAQLTLPGMDLPEEVMTETLDCLEAIQQGDISALQHRIPDIAYRRNFYALAKRLAPDGVGIRSVGFTSMVPGRVDRLVLLTRYEAAFPRPESLVPGEKGTPVRIRGTLKFADSTRDRKDEIRLKDVQGGLHRIRVPEGMMDDIVRPLWDYEVEVFAMQRGSTTTLQTITRISDDSEVATTDEAE